MADRRETTPSAPEEGRRLALWALIVVACGFAATLPLRADLFLERVGAPGVEATYHVLWTAMALTGSDESAHFYLPTVTLNPDPGTLITWGATVPTPGGAFIYTSFPPLSFLLFTAILQIGGTTSFLALSLVNAALGFVAALAMGGLARDAVLSFRRDLDDRERLGWLVFTLCAVAYLFMPEAMVSHGPVVWAHSLSQIVLIAGCWLTLRLLTKGATPAVVAGLALVAAVYPSLEWTGFVFNAGLFGVLALVALRSRDRATAIAAACVAAATIAAGLAILVHFSAAIGLDRLIPALTSRAAARAHTGVHPLSLPLGYLVSFGALVPLAALALWRLLSTSRATGKGCEKDFWLVMVVACVPMIENAIMLQHAVQFPFDRLKLAVPLLLLCAMALATLRPRMHRGWMVLVLMVALVGSNLHLFFSHTARFAPWGPVHAANTRLLEAFRQDAVSSCQVVGSNGVARGYLNFSVRADIRELTTPEEIQTYANSDGNCAVFIHTRHVFPDLPEFLEINIFDAQGTLLRRFGPA